VDKIRENRLGLCGDVMMREDSEAKRTVIELSVIGRK